VTADVAKAVADIKGGKINFRVDKQANCTSSSARRRSASRRWPRTTAPRDEILRAKPSPSKGRYLKKVVVSTTTGPGIPVDPAITVRPWNDRDRRQSTHSSDIPVWIRHTTEDGVAGDGGVRRRGAE
jgi:hypothetical protein